MFRIPGITGTWVLTCGLALAMLLPPDGALARKIYPLHAFGGGSDGYYPRGNLIADAAGNFYGTTEGGGVSSVGGTVFKLAPDGTETILHAFTGGSDGETPYAGLVLDSAGNLYGTTISGGTAGLGVVFKVAPDGNESVLHTFTGGKDGMVPYASLVRRKGILYGTTYWGGSNYRCTNQNGCGMVFALAKDGTMTVLHAFSGGSDGGFPAGGVIADKSGNLYGTTQYGGSASCGLGCGTVFEIPFGGKEKVLHAFTNGSDGFQPIGVLTADNAGNLFGATYAGGSHSAGTVYKVTSKGSETVLYSFTGGNDGGNPYAGVIADASGNLYGTTGEGGKIGYGYGVIFKLATNGKLSVLHTFCYDCKTGSRPAAGLLADSQGNMYGTATEAGHYGGGTVFELPK